MTVVMKKKETNDDVKFSLTTGEMTLFSVSKEN